MQGPVLLVPGNEFERLQRKTRLSQTIEIVVHELGSYLVKLAGGTNATNLDYAGLQKRLVNKQWQSVAKAMSLSWQSELIVSKVS